MIRNGLFEETNEQSIFFQNILQLQIKFPVYNVQWRILQWKISPYKNI